MSHSAPISRRSFARMAALLAVPITPMTLVSRSGAQEGTPLKVAASFSILADWVSNVSGDAVEVTPVVSTGGDAHTFDPDPATVANIAGAEVIFAIGAGFEGWLADMVEASGNSAPIIEVTEGMTLITGEDEDEHDHEADDHGHDDSEGDPHVWGNVGSAIIAVELIRSTLAEVDPDRADTYQANADAYTTKLEELDAAIRKQVATIPEENRKLVTSHDTFAYYAEAYGFEVVGTALGSISTESGDPSAGDIAELVESIRDTGVPAIFAENVVNPALMQSLADEAGVELAPTLYSDALGEEGSEGATYIDMMTYNTETIVTALQGE
jgi:ABC-type Zn uptake system ZnuABC Zn-binding protein ZnuA